MCHPVIKVNQTKGRWDGDGMPCYLTVEHQLRLLDDLPDADGAVPAAGGHRPFPDAGVHARDPVLVAEERLDVRHLVHVPHLHRPGARFNGLNKFCLSFSLRNRLNFDLRLRKLRELRESSLHK